MNKNYFVMIFCLFCFAFSFINFSNYVYADQSSLNNKNSIREGEINRKDFNVPVKEITIMTHNSFSVSENVVKIFEMKNHAKIKFLKAGDAGEALNKEII